MKPEQLVENVAIYRKAWTDAGHDGAGIVTLMLHTFVGPTWTPCAARCEVRSWNT